MGATRPARGSVTRFGVALDWKGDHQPYDLWSGFFLLLDQQCEPVEKEVCSGEESKSNEYRTREQYLSIRKLRLFAHLTLLAG
jgi:hypothetical protein